MTLWEIYGCWALIAACFKKGLFALGYDALLKIHETQGFPCNFMLHELNVEYFLTESGK